MKKMIALCLLLLSGFSNTQIKQPNHSSMLEGIDYSKYQKIMIVAHPDDETIWGGAHLLTDQYLVICLTNGDNPVRSKEFKNVVKKSQDKGIILNYPDKVKGKRDDWKKVNQQITNDLDYVLSRHNYDLVVTHNPDGEYGHQHHKMTSTIVTKLIKAKHQEKHLQYFGHYYKKSQVSGDSKYTRSLLKQKDAMIALYSSQNKTCHKLQHMFPYENWISYQNW